MHDDGSFYEVLFRVDGGVLEQVRRIVYDLRPAWHRQAACRGVGPDVFFPERGGDLTQARRLCSGCPVAAECAQAGRDEPAGVWAGVSPRGRRAAAA